MIGGIFSYMLLRDEKPELARHFLVFGLILEGMWIVVAAIVGGVTAWGAPWGSPTTWAPQTILSAFGL